MTENIEQGRVLDLAPVEQNAKSSEDGLLVVSSVIPQEVTAQIVSSVGKPLHEEINKEIEKGMGLLAIEDNDTYIQAADTRRALNVFKTGKGDKTIPVRVSLVIAPNHNEKVGVVMETLVGLASTDNFYGPIATMLHQLHRAVTGGKAEAESAIDTARELLEDSILAYQEKLAKLKREAEEAQKLVNEQNDRTARAEHYIAELGKVGETYERIGGLLSNGIGKVTEDEITVLRDLLAEKLQAAEEAKQQKELDDAIATAKQMGFDGMAKELEQQKASPPPVITEVPAPAPARTTPVSSAVSQYAAPKAKGMGKKTVFDLVIVNPSEIPAEFLLPPVGKEFDAENYPRLRAMAKTEGPALMNRCPGIRVEEAKKLTQR
jgi:hypothetical protein